MNDADRPPHTRLAVRTSAFNVFATILLTTMMAVAGGGVAIAKSAVKPKPGLYSGDVGLFKLSFKVSPNGEKLHWAKDRFSRNCQLRSSG